MKTPLIRSLFLCALLAFGQCPSTGYSRGPVSQKEDNKKGNNNKKSGNNSNRNPPQGGGGGGRGGATSSSQRNPLTGSSVSRGQSNQNRSNARPNNNKRPDPKPAAKNDRKPDNKPNNSNNNRSNPNNNGNNNNKPNNRPPAPNPNNRPPNQADAKPSGGRTGATQPANRPAPNPPKVAAKPQNQKPDSRDRDRNRPNASGGRAPFVPGKVTYPNQVAKPNHRPASNARPAHKQPKHRPTTVGNVVSNRYSNRSNTTNITNINNTNISRKTNNNWGNQWNNKTSIWNNSQTTYRGPVVINRNFSNSVNYAYRPSSWGSRPWWSSSTYHNWHHGSWNYGWNRSYQRYHNHSNYYRPQAQYFPGYRPYNNYGRSSSSVAWGVAAWSLGSLIYNSGYNSYRNPYEAPPVQTRTTVINYSQPISVIASREEPEAEDAALTSAEKSSAALENARNAFRAGDYLAALKSTDESISFAGGDPALHEFRALCLFALARYGDAAGVLNPVLASGPGWDWATMSDFYSDGEVYTAQLRKLEAYVAGKPDSADSRFLLGYHYMVAGFIDEAYEMFDRVTELQPADTVAAQLRDLAGSSSASADGDTEDTEVLDPADPAIDPTLTVEPIDPGDIIGKWKAASPDGKAITLELTEADTFTWDYEGAPDGKVLAGEWSIDEEGQLVLVADDVQMVAEISLDGDSMQFILAGSPVGDPGLQFEFQP
jgi:tetratricopeptide (TPR) repeat protein